jgi:hypothetical protein
MPFMPMATAIVVETQRFARVFIIVFLVLQQRVTLVGFQRAGEMKGAIASPSAGRGSNATNRGRSSAEFKADRG